MQREVGVEGEFRVDEVWKEGEKMEKEWAGYWAELKKGMVSGHVMPSRAEHRGCDENKVTEISAAGTRNQRKEKRVQSGNSAGNN